MKRRFDINPPLNGRTAPPVRHRYEFSPRRPALSDQPTPEPSSSSASLSFGELFASGVELRLEDEVPADELSDFTHCLLQCLGADQGEDQAMTPVHAVSQKLPSFVQLKIEHQAAMEDKKEQHSFTKKLVKASEPLINHGQVAESEKAGLLDIGALSVEKLMQLKMREANLAQRVEFLQQAIPQYMNSFSKELGYSDQLCADITQLTQTVLKDY